MSNTINASLTTKALIQATLASAAAVAPPLERIFRLAQAPIASRPSLTVEHANCTATPAMVTDPTDWESGNSTVAAVEIPMHSYAKCYGLSNADVQSGSTLASIAGKAAEDFVLELLDVILAPLTTANYGAAAVTASSDVFGQADFDTLASSITSRAKTVVLSTPYAQKVKGPWIPATGLPVYEIGRWTGAGSNVVGFVADPSALVIIHGKPSTAATSRGPLSLETFTLPGIGIPVELAAWELPGTRSLRVALTVHLGVAVGIVSSLRLIKSA